MHKTLLPAGLIILIKYTIIILIRFIIAMKPSGKSHSRDQIRRLVFKPKELYSLFNIFELQMSRLMRLQTFKRLVQQLLDFNEELKNWKNDTHQIKNIAMAYSLYENLFSRLRYIMNFSRTIDHAASAVKDAITWYFMEKPKARCEVKEVKAQLKQNSEKKMPETAISFWNQIEEEKEAYRVMSRTTYKQIPPPKQRLKQFKRKQIQLQQAGSQKKNPLVSTRRSMTSFSKFRDPVIPKTSSTTRLTFNTTKDSFLNSNSKGEEAEKITPFDKVEEKEQNIEKLQEQKINQNNLEQKEEHNPEKDKLEELAAQENYIGPEENDIQQEEMGQEDQDKGPKVKAYTLDRDPQDLSKIEDLSNEAYHKSVRRTWKIKEEKIRSKMEDIQARSAMQQWSKLKSNFYKKFTKTAESLKHLNRYKQMQSCSLKKQPLSSKNISARKIEQSKPIQVFLTENIQKNPKVKVEKQLNSFKIDSTVSRYGKYIDGFENKQQNKMDILHTQGIKEHSLTSIGFYKKQPKHFSNIIEDHGQQAYNEDLDSGIQKIKSFLAAKSIAVDKKTIHEGMTTVIPPNTKRDIQRYKMGRSLPSNPFFIKSLSVSKKKPKK